MTLTIPGYATIVDGIACKVGSSIITIHEFNKNYEREQKNARLLGQEPPDKLEVMNALINNVLVRMSAEDKGIMVTDDELNSVVEDVIRQNNLTKEEFLDELERENITLKELRESYELDIIQVRLVNDLASDNVNLVTDEDVVGFYNDPENRAFFRRPGLVKLSQIFISVPEDVTYKDAVDIKQRVLDLYERARSGEDFTDLVLEYSESPNKEESLGSIGSFTRSQLERIVSLENVDALFSLDEGDVAPPIRFRDGYYLMRVDEKIEDTYLSLEESYDSIRNYLMRLKGKELLDDLLVSMRKTVNVKIMIDME
jgi:peptidyl-prolyl cis-trans isomerase SurA